jgi:hypothetical protein
MILDVGEHLDKLGTCPCPRCGLWRATRRDVNCIPCQKFIAKKHDLRRRERWNQQHDRIDTTEAAALDREALLKGLARSGYGDE